MLMNSFSVKKDCGLSQTYDILSRLMFDAIMQMSASAVASIAAQSNHIAIIQNISFGNLNITQMCQPDLIAIVFNNDKIAPRTIFPSPDHLARLLSYEGACLHSLENHCRYETGIAGRERHSPAAACHTRCSKVGQVPSSAVREYQTPNRYSHPTATALIPAGDELPMEPLSLVSAY